MKPLDELIQCITDYTVEFVVLPAKDEFKI